MTNLQFWNKIVPFELVKRLKQHDFEQLWYYTCNFTTLFLKCFACFQLFQEKQSKTKDAKKHPNTQQNHPHPQQMISSSSLSFLNLSVQNPCICITKELQKPPGFLCSFKSSFSSKTKFCFLLSRFAYSQSKYLH